MHLSVCAAFVRLSLQIMITIAPQFVKSYLVPIPCLQQTQTRLPGYFAGAKIALAPFLIPPYLRVKQFGPTFSRRGNHTGPATVAVTAVVSQGVLRSKGDAS